MSLSVARPVKAGIGLALALLVFGCATESDPFDPDPRPTLDVVALDPPSGAVGVSPLTHITVSFPVPMDARTIHRNSLLLTEAGPAFTEKRRLRAVQVLYDADRNIATMIPLEPLRENTEYQVLIQDVRTLDRIFVNARVATFLTGILAPEAPRVIAIRPLLDATVPVTSTIEVTFSSLMDRASLLQTFSVAPAVPGTATFDELTQTRLVFTPSFPLPAGREVLVTIRPEARDRNGRSLGATFLSAFRVEAPPQVIFQSVDPLPDGVGISTQTAISMEFTAAMDPDALMRAFSLRFGSTVLDANDGTFTLTTLTTDPFNPANPGPSRTRLVYQPTNPLPASTTITIRIDPEARSVRGVPLDPLFLALFTTG